MGQSRESSLIFSLKDLEALERDRIRNERAECEARAKAAQLAESERSERARGEERRCLEADERARQAEERLCREETARLDALGRAAVERARAEVEVRASAELARARERHELSLAAIQADSARGRHRRMLLASGAALVIVGGLAADLSMDLRRAQTLDDDRLSLLSREREACAKVRGALTSTERSRSELERRLATLATEEPHAARAVSDVHAAPPVVPLRREWTVPRGLRTVEASTRPPACNGDGDPLNGCLPRP